MYYEKRLKRQMTDKREFGMVFRRHYDGMFRLAMRLLGDEAESKDVVSDVFAQLLHSGTDLRSETLKAFLVRISAKSVDSLLEVRIMLKVEDLSWDFSSPVYGSNEAQPRIRVSKEGGDLVVLLRFPKGGAA